MKAFAAFLIFLSVSLQVTSTVAVAKSAAAKRMATAGAKKAPTPEQDEAMADAISKGNFTKAKALHKAGVGYDVLGSDELTGLMRLADEGDSASIKEALKLGAELNTKNSNNENALWYAVYSGHEALALELLKKGATASDIRPDSKECLMHMTAQSGLVEMSAKLVKLTPKCLTQKDADGHTPSEVAKSLGYKKVAKILAIKK